MPDNGHAEPVLDEIAAEQARLRPLAATAPALEQEQSDVQRRIASIEGSASWQLTTPLRATAAVVAGRRRLVLRAGRRLRAHLER